MMDWMNRSSLYAGTEPPTVFPSSIDSDHLANSVNREVEPLLERVPELEAELLLYLRVRNVEVFDVAGLPVVVLNLTRISAEEAQDGLG